MAITFRRGPRTLVNAIEQADYRIVEISSDIGDLSRSMQIRLKNGVVVNWDRASYSVWAQGPEALCEKIEAHLASRHRKHRSQRKLSAVSIFAILLLIFCLLLVLAWEVTNRQSAPTPLQPDTARNGDSP